MSEHRPGAAGTDLSPAEQAELRSLVGAALWFAGRGPWIGGLGALGGVVVGIVGGAFWWGGAKLVGVSVPGLAALAPFGFVGASAPLLLVAWALGRTARPSFLSEGKPKLKPPVLDMVPIPGGTFQMGSTEFGDEQPVHEVRVSAFEMARTPVTEAQWKEQLGEGNATQLPKGDVSWHDAIRFCNALSERHGFTPCYDGDVCNFAADGYRLPTEAEWEYACCAGTTTRFWWGDDEEGATRHAWFRGNSNGRRRVGAAEHENAFRVSDMAGNVWEWCNDRDGAYDSHLINNPTGPDVGVDRVLRGGSWSGGTVNLRSALRFRLDPSFSLGNVGFRCVRVPRPEP